MLRHSSKSEATLHIQWPIVRTPITALVMLCSLGFGIEIIAHTGWVRTNLPAQSWGSQYFNIDIKHAILEAYTENTPINCIFIGSSVVNMGMDPDIIQESYYAQTGEDLRCFNLGLDAIVADSIGNIAEIIYDDYHPKVIIYGTIARDFSEAAKGDNHLNIARIDDSDWAQYRSGNFSWQGWLIDNSAAYRYYLGFRESLDPAYISLNTYRDSLQPNGYGGIDGVSAIRNPADPIPLSDYTAIMTEFEVSESGLTGLRQLFSLQQRGVKIVVVQVPYHPRLAEAFSNSYADDAMFVDKISLESRTHGVVFWSTSNQPSIPLDGWFDFYHLDMAGASVYSHWLGTQLGQLNLQDRPQP